MRRHFKKKRGSTGGPVSAAVLLLRKRGGGAMLNIASDWGLVGGAGAEVTILISSTTRAQLPVGFTAAAVGSHLVKGRSERIDVYQLLGPEAEA